MEKITLHKIDSTISPINTLASITPSLSLSSMEDDHESGFNAPLSIVSLTPFSPSFSPSPCRLSTHFTKPNRPVRAARQLAWVSLQGRLVGAEEASSAATIGGGLSPDEAVAWELFSPMHRILVVAVVAVAAANSKKNRQIFQLRKSVELRVSNCDFY